MNNFTITTNATLDSTDSILCPYNGRRSSKELWVKLFIVHLTTISAFCHILSVRREPIVKWKLVFYILVPYSLFAYHALALLAFLAGLAVYLVKPSDDLRDSLQRAPLWFFGVVPQESEASYELLPSAARPGTESPPALERESKWKRIGRVLLASTFLVQCIGTVVLYNRRRKHHAATFADQRIFELGSTGIVTAVYWLLLILELPPFSIEAPSPDSGARNSLDNIMVQSRDCTIAPFITKDDDVPGVLSFLKNGAICFIIELIQRKLRLFEFLAQLIYEFRTGDDTPSGNEFTLEFIVFIIGISIGGCVSVVTCCGTPQSKQSRYMGKRRKASKGDDKAWWMFLLCPIGLLFLWLPVLVLIGGIIVFVMCPYEWTIITDQISTLDAWPTNTSCPLLWSDPAANWIWALA